MISTADFSSAIHLRYTVTSGFIEIIQVLLNLGANINELNNYDQSVLHHIGLFESAEVAEFLLKYPENRSFFYKWLPGSINVNTKDKYGRRALHYAAVRSLGVVKLLVERGIDTHVKDNLGITALKSATINESVDIATFLKSIGAQS